MKQSKIYPWVVVALLWVVALLNYMDRQMLSTMQSAMQLDIVELQKGEAFGWLMGIFLWVYGLVSPFAGMAGDRFSRKWLVVGSLFVWSGVTFLMGYADSFGQLFALRAVMGVSEALYLPGNMQLLGWLITDRDAFAEAGAVQCGFCIPGMVMAAQALLLTNSHPDEEDVRMAISGNICRCTGYDLIVDAVLLASRKGEGLW